MVSVAWDLRILENLLDEPIELAKQLPCQGSELCTHCKLMNSLKERQWLVSGVFLAVKGMAEKSWEHSFGAPPTEE
jgi:hypothetical protein